MSGRVALEYAQAHQRASTCLYRNAGHDFSSSSRSVPPRHRYSGKCLDRHAQSSQRGKHALRGRHQGDAGFNPCRATSQNRSSRSCHCRQRQFLIAPKPWLLLTVNTQGNNRRPSRRQRATEATSNLLTRVSRFNQVTLLRAIPSRSLSVKLSVKVVSSYEK